jgi:hypothetical protein
MKEIIVDLTEKEERQKRNPCPCDRCITGYASQSVSLPYIDSKTGHKIRKITSSDCHDDCQRFKEWVDRGSRRY